MLNALNNIDTELDDFFTQEYITGDDKRESDDNNIDNDPKEIKNTEILDTAFRLATSSDEQGFGKIIREHPWTIYAKRDDGSSILHLVTFVNKISFIHKLLRFNANIDDRDNNGQTPIYYAVISGSVTTTKYLIRNRAQVNVTDNDGNSPLHIAVINSHAEIVKLLLDADADVSIKNCKNHTPFDYSILDKTIFDILVDHIGRKR